MRLAALIVLSSFVVVHTAGAAQEIPPSEKPNIVYILTDDLDNHTLNQMETTRSLLANKGVTFKNATFSDPLCCPSYRNLAERMNTCSGAGCRNIEQR